jgi:mono/diheme cytochrome c family protein
MFERMLVGKIENRITVGIVCFVGTMVLLGWAAINEGGRMLALEDTYHARAIEQGAALFASQCTRCHGPDGRGLAGYAPGLNNPQFFGHDFYPEITSQVNTLQGERAALEAEAESSEVPVTPERQTEITTRLSEIDAEIDALNTPREADLAAAAELGYDPSRPSRLQNLGWVGTHESFVLTTLIHGRPTSGNYYQQGAMPAWSQTAGGPLRMDQLEDLVAYVQNWDKGDQWTVDDLFAVKQFAIEPVNGAPLEALIQQLEDSGGQRPEPVGNDVAAVLTALEGVTGDAARGDALYHNQERSQMGEQLACSGCHIQTANGTGPMADGTFTRINETRLQDSALAGYTPEQYIVESILRPGAYIVPGFQNLMVADLGERITLQDLADLLAYIETLNQPAS